MNHIVPDWSFSEVWGHNLMFALGLNHVVTDWSSSHMRGPFFHIDLKLSSLQDESFIYPYLFFRMYFSYSVMSFVLISICCPCFPDWLIFADQSLDVTVVRFCARVPFQRCLVALCSRFNGSTYFYICFSQAPLLKYLPTISRMTSWRITVAIIRRNFR